MYAYPYICTVKSGKFPSRTIASLPGSYYRAATMQTYHYSELGSIVLRRFRSSVWELWIIVKSGYCVDARWSILYSCDTSCRSWYKTSCLILQGGHSVEYGWNMSTCNGSVTTGTMTGFLTGRSISSGYHLNDTLRSIYPYWAHGSVPRSSMVLNSWYHDSPRSKIE